MTLQVSGCLNGYLLKIKENICEPLKYLKLLLKPLHLLLLLLYYYIVTFTKYNYFFLAWHNFF